MRKDDTVLRSLWAVTLSVPTTLLAGDPAPPPKPGAHLERPAQWRPMITDPTSPLVRSQLDSSRERALRQAEHRLRPYRFGDAAYLRFHEYIQDAGNLKFTHPTNPVPDPQPGR